MKKILSAVLAVSLLSSMAMADIAAGTSNVTEPGAKITVDESMFANKNGALPDLGWRFSSEFFNVSSKTFSKGANLVKEVVFDDDTNLLNIKLNDNYDLAKPANSPNLVIKKLAVKAKSTIEDSNKVELAKKGQEYEYVGNGTTDKEFFVGFDVKNNEVALDDNEGAYTPGQLVKFTDGSDKEAYGTATLDGDDNVYLEGRVYSGDKVYVKVDTAPSDEAKAVMKANGDAEMRFVKVITNGFPSNNTINLTAEEDEFVYQIKDGKLVESGLKWSEDDFAFTGKIRSTTEYVISDIELVAAAPDASGSESAPEVANPDTGANDVVGIAAALAVVSLVAAGAVSLKK